MISPGGFGLQAGPGLGGEGAAPRTGGRRGVGKAAAQQSEAEREGAAQVWEPRGSSTQCRERRETFLCGAVCVCVCARVCVCV